MSSSYNTTTVTIPGAVVTLIIVLWIFLCWYRGTCCFRRIHTAVALAPVPMTPSVTVIQHAPAPPPPKPSPSQTNNYFIMPGQMPGQPPQGVDHPPPYVNPPMYSTNQPTYLPGQPTYSPHGYNPPAQQYSPHANYPAHHQGAMPPYTIEKNVQSAPPQQPMFNPSAPNF